jgi:PAS domain S-box-containing protein
MALDRQAKREGLLDALPCAVATLEQRAAAAGAPSGFVVAAANAEWRRMFGPAGDEGRQVEALLGPTAPAALRAAQERGTTEAFRVRDMAGRPAILRVAMAAGRLTCAAMPLDEIPSAPFPAMDAGLEFAWIDGAGAWEWRAEGNSLNWTASMYDLFGVSPDSFGGTLSDVAALLPPEDADRVMGEWREAARRDDAFVHRFRIPLLSGGVRWIAARARVTERGADGAPLRIVGVSQDVTAEMEALDRAAAAERRFVDAIEALPDGFVIYDADDRLVACNTRYREIYRRSLGAIARGAAFEEVLREGVANGQYPEARGLEEAFIAERLRQHRLGVGESQQLLPDDRWVRIVERRTVAGDTVGFRVDVTEFKRQERELRDAKARAEAAAAELARTTSELQNFFDLSLDLLGIADMNGRFLKLSAAWRAALGHPREALLARSYLDFIHPDDHEATRASMAALAEGRAVHGFVNRYRTADGDWRMLEWRSTPVDHGLVYFVARDVTAREAELRRREAKAAEERALTEVMALALGGSDAAAFATAALERVVALTPWLADACCAGVFLTDGGADGGPLRTVAHHPADGEEDCLAALRDGPAPTPGAGESAADACTAASAATRLVIPIGNGAQRLGLLAVHMAGDRVVDSSEAAFLGRVADALALGLDSRAAAARAEEERRRALDALEAVRSYQSALDMHAIVSVTDRAGNIEAVNSRFCEISGYSEAELIGRNHRIVNSGVHPREFFAEMWHTISAGRPWRGEVCNRHRSGSHYWVDATIIPVRDVGGRIERYVAVRYDITDRKRMADALADRNRRLRQITELAGVGGWEYDIARGKLLWDGIARRIHEVDASFEPDVATAIGFYAPESQPIIRAALAACIEERIPYDLELRCATAGGRRIWVRTVGAPIIQNDSVVRIAGSIQDITDRRNQAAEAEAMRARFEAIFERTDQIMFLKRHDGTYLAANRRFREQVDRDDVVGLTDYDFNSEADSDRFAALEAGVFATGEPVITEETIQRPGARRQHFVSSKFLIPDVLEGEEVLCCVATEVTELRAREVEAERMRARFEAIFENSGAMVFLKDRDGRYIAANRRMLGLIGRDSVEGLRAAEVYAPEVAAAFDAQAAKVFACGRPVTSEERWPDRDGVTRDYLVSLVPISDAGNGEQVLCGLLTEITEQKRREREIEGLRARFEAIFEQSDAAISLRTRDNRVVASNSRMLALFGAQEAPQIGGPDYLTPAARRCVEDAIRQVFDTGEVVRSEETYPDPSGERRTFMVTRSMLADPVRGEPLLCTIATDITERRRREAEIEGLRARFEAFFDSTDAQMYIKDRDTRVLWVNARCRAFMPGVEQVGRTNAEIFPPDAAERVTADDRTVFETGKPMLFEEEAARPDGVAVHFLTSKFLIYDPSIGDHLLCGVSTDITASKRLQARLEQSRMEAEQASRAKSQFLATMSHEIRTPMNGVIGMAELLSRRMQDPEERRMLRVIRESGEVLMNVINDILDFSKVESGKLDIETVPFSLAEVARKVEGVHTLKASEKGVSFSVLSSAGCDAPRLGDPHRIQQVLHNLISNAIKFTEEGEVTVTIRCAPQGPVAIEVRDTGLGMTPEQAARVFEPFAQADSSTSRRYGGTGLGLPIVKSLVEAMGGEIAMDSTPGWGTTVRLKLPLPPAGAMGREAPASVSENDIPPGLRVLAADDNEVNRMVLGAFLDSLGVAHEIAEGGAEAVAAAAKGGYDLLMLDISMPGMDGMEALAAIREGEAKRSAKPAPSVAVTANAMTHQIEEFIAAGFDAHLAKPIKREELIERLIRLGRRPD